MKDTPSPSKPPKTTSLLLLVAECLTAGDPAAALALIGQRPTGERYVENARGVCLLRLGRASEAVDLYRELLVDRDSLILDLEAPPAFLVNFATALLLSGNIDGCRSTLEELKRDADPDVIALRAAMAKWRSDQGWWAKMKFALSGTVAKPVVLDFPPGALAYPDQGRPSSVA